MDTSSRQSRHVERIRETVEVGLKRVMSVDQSRVLVSEPDRTLLSAALSAVARSRGEAGIVVVQELTPAAIARVARSPPWVIWLGCGPDEAETARTIWRLRAACPYAALLVRLPEDPDVALETLHRAGADHIVTASRAAEAFASLVELVRVGREIQFRMAARTETARQIAVLRSPAEARRAGYSPPPPGRVPTLDDVNRAAVRSALAATGGRKAAAARLLDVSRPRLDRLMRRFGIDGYAR